MHLTMDSIFDMAAQELDGVKFASDSMENKIFDLLATNLILHAALTDPNIPKDSVLRKQYKN